MSVWQMRFHLQKEGCSMKRTCQWLLCLVLMLSVLGAPALAWGSSPADDYQSALNLLKECKYEEAASSFASLAGYADAPRYAMYCSAIAAAEQGNYAVAVVNLQQLGDFLDSSLRVTYYAALSYEASEEYEEAQDLLLGISLYLDSQTHLASYPAKILARDYARADALEAAGELEDALTAFTKLGDYQDSAARVETLREKIKVRDYDAALALKNAGKLQDAYDAFRALGDYKDSKAQLTEIQEAINAAKYAQANKAEENGQYADAYDLFTALGDYRDSAARAEAVQQRANYAKGMEAIASGNYKTAYTLFSELGDYEDSASKAYMLGINSFASLKQMTADVAQFTFHDKVGLVNFTTNTTLAPHWNCIYAFEDGVAIVYDGSNYGLIDTQGKVIKSCKYPDITMANNGLRVIATKDTSRSGKWDTYYLFQLTDNQGNVLGTESWSELGDCYTTDWGTPRTSASVFHNDRIRVGYYSKAVNSTRYGFIDRNGKEVIPAKYFDAHEFSNGLAAVKDTSGKWGFIDPDGNVVIKCQYREVTDFTSEGLADVCLYGTWQIIDKTGNLVYFK